MGWVTRRGWDKKEKAGFGTLLGGLDGISGW